MILMIDNYDSFTYNLVQYLGEVTEERAEIRVVRNDETFQMVILEVQAIAKNYDGLYRWINAFTHFEIVFVKQSLFTKLTLTFLKPY